jgi:hypothetical protein|nr:MAG TPA: hypothetical protein [Caudoviricetes sp.]
MNDPVTFEDISKLEESIKDHQLIVGYAIFRALKENKNITSIKDFYDFVCDAETNYNNHKDLHML